MTDRIEWIDAAKTITMILVIIGHCNYYRIDTLFGGIYYVDKNTEVSLAYECLACFVSFIYSFHMPLFMALSGMCFSLSMRKPQSFKVFLKSKAVRLLIPFITVSLFLSIPVKYLSGYWDCSQSVVIDIICGQLLLMGNSHLWFVVSLFWIFVFFYYIVNKEFSGKKLWIGLIIISWIGLYVEPRCNFLGIPGTMKHLLFFSIGYYSFQWINNQKGINIKELVIYIVGLFLLFVTYSSLLRHYPDCVLLKAVKPFLYIFFAISGIFIFCFLSKSLQSKYSSCRLGIIAFLKHNNYEMYLYSDPFNYIIVALCWKIFDGIILVDDELTLIVFLLRFVCTTLFAILTFKIVGNLHLKRINHLIEKK